MLGEFLCGGIASCVMLAMAANKLGNIQIATFTISYKEPSYDKLNDARRAAVLFDRMHYEELISVERARELIARVMRGLDEPLGNPQSSQPICNAHWHAGKVL